MRNLKDCRKKGLLYCSSTNQPRISANYHQPTNTKCEIWEATQHQRFLITITYEQMHPIIRWFHQGTLNWPIHKQTRHNLQGKITSDRIKYSTTIRSERHQTLSPWHDVKVPKLTDKCQQWDTKSRVFLIEGNPCDVWAI